MSDGIYNGQEVTSDDLNNIAIDLGNTSFNGFGNEKFGASKLNEITASLVTSGVLLSGNRLKPVPLTNKISISDGTVVFNDGSRKTISTAVTIPYQKGLRIWIMNNVTEGTATLESGTAYPTEGDFVKIARTIPLGGTDYTLVDEREFCNGKTTFTNVSTGIEKTVSTIEYASSTYYIATFDTSVFFQKEYIIFTRQLTQSLATTAIEISRIKGIEETITNNDFVSIGKFNSEYFYIRYANDEKTEIQIGAKYHFDKAIIIGGNQSEQSN